ncbi:MAG: hypothetical protein IPK15_24400 [Verrucomicrobia bacterium]|jgi:hypothetical protein|nr:hypothetical protein [Verrucomicrobiota bacterium]
MKWNVALSTNTTTQSNIDTRATVDLDQFHQGLKCVYDFASHQSEPQAVLESLCTAGEVA